MDLRRGRLDLQLLRRPLEMRWAGYSIDRQKDGTQGREVCEVSRAWLDFTPLPGDLSHVTPEV